MKYLIRMICALLIMGMVCACAEEVPELTAEGYVLVSLNSESRWFPLADEETGEYSFTVHQVVDGMDMNNTILITTEGVCVSDADCENHDCIEEGTVTLANKDERILGNMIVCLPHTLMIELFTREEMEELLNSSAAEQTP